MIKIKFKKPLSIVVLLLLIMGNNVYALDVVGTIDTDTIWHVSDSPVVVTESVWVTSGATLTIEAISVPESHQPSVLIDPPDRS